MTQTDNITIKQVIAAIEEKLPLALQENYDNCGVQAGDINQPATGALLAVDITEAVVDEAIALGCNLIITHHPPLFKSLKSITGKNYVERCLIKAIRNNLVLYAAHTNADNAAGGLNFLLAEKFGLLNVKPIDPMKNLLKKIVCYVPHSHAEVVRDTMWHAGGGVIGDYDCCSFNLPGHGTFRATPDCNPFVGEIGQLHTEPETAVSMVVPSFKLPAVIRQMLSVHPYEEPAYDVLPMDNVWQSTGAGIIGDLTIPMTPQVFLQKVQSVFNVKHLSYSDCKAETIKCVAICGGAGGFLCKQAAAKGADVFVTGEAKYNDFFDVEGQPMLVTVGHYESEVVATELFYKIISDKMSNFGVYLSKICANPVHHL